MPNAPITLSDVNKEIAQHHAMMKVAKDLVQVIDNTGNLPQPVKNFYTDEKNAFWFTREDIDAFKIAFDAGEINYLLVVLGAHFSGQQGFAEGSQTAILVGADQITVQENLLLQVNHTGPYRQYPTQAYVSQIAN